MAIKGPSYTKTQWVFEERPVSSSKLNQWDDRIEAALETAFYLLSLAWGGGNGVLRGTDLDELAVAETAPASLAVTVSSGYGFIDRLPFRLDAAVTTAAVQAPVSQDRIDLVQADLETWNVSVKTGSESATPSAPSPDSGAMALAALVLRPGMTVIKDSDDGSNGYIVDARAFV